MRGGVSYSEEVLVESLLGPRLCRTHLSQEKLFRFTFRSFYRLSLFSSSASSLRHNHQVGQWGHSTATTFPFRQSPSSCIQAVAQDHMRAGTLAPCSSGGWLAAEECAKAEVGQHELLEPRVERRAQGRSRRSVLDRHTHLRNPPSSPDKHTRHRTRARVVQSENEPCREFVWCERETSTYLLGDAGGRRQGCHADHYHHRCGSV
jgi:hypothetical protein